MHIRSGSVPLRGPGMEGPRPLGPRWPHSAATRKGRCCPPLIWGFIFNHPGHSRRHRGRLTGRLLSFSWWQKGKRRERLGTLSKLSRWQPVGAQPGRGTGHGSLPSPAPQRWVPQAPGSLPGTGWRLCPTARLSREVSLHLPRPRLLHSADSRGLQRAGPVFSPLK